MTDRPDAYAHQFTRRAVLARLAKGSQTTSSIALALAIDIGLAEMLLARLVAIGRAVKFGEFYSLPKRRA